MTPSAAPARAVAVAVAIVVVADATAFARGGGGGLAWDAVADGVAAGAAGAGLLRGVVSGHWWSWMRRVLVVEVCIADGL